MKKKLPEDVAEWIRCADEDRQAARVLLRGRIYNQACFHSQQAVEKLLKSALVLKGTHVPKIHDLNELLIKCIEANLFLLLPFKDDVATLSLYYVPTRYPDALVGTLPDRLPNAQDAKEALAISESLWEHLARGLFFVQDQRMKPCKPMT